MIQQEDHRIVYAVMRLALRKEMSEGGYGGKPGKFETVIHDVRSTGREKLGDKQSQMLLEPGVPGYNKRISRLKDGPHPTRASPADQPQASSVFARQYLEDSAGFPMPPDRQYDRLVFPLHGLSDRLAV